MDDSLDAAWDSMLTSAASMDESYGRPGSVGLTALVERAIISQLKKFYPFTSVGMLCFSTGPHWWKGEGEPLPAFVTIDQEGTYRVWSGGPYIETVDEVEQRLVTHNASEAIAEVERILAPGQNSRK